MQENGKFVDHYKVLQVDPLCDDRSLEIAYHYFAKIYHPDNAETTDLEKFTQVIESYKILRNAETRSAYDRVYDREIGLPRSDEPAAVAPTSGLQDAALDGDVHETILLRLYRKRRENAHDPGLGAIFLQDELGCSDAEMDFHLWYLKAKNLVEITEQGMMAITIAGVDHVLATSRNDQEKHRMRLIEAQNPQLTEDTEQP